jgi:aminobenzoyl-glutamate transport protein
MLPFAITIIIAWTAFLLIYWGLGFPLGLQSSYVYPVSQRAN